ncbi:hypothetical protein LX24_01708 [Desulfallas thermosapovorans DSM 6562]|uniref:Uncharacterized protein n=1 Tax=Desulfallas thermosapovorans DSM 6562 TaxID=1121431 RepID=A0A5S4ZRK2_9FIRM|nr:hypothetical protein LX24_01708 [Desulfallas thermosapovorans DSM 6562]
MLVFAGMNKANIRMIPVLDYVYRDKCACFYKLNYKNPGKAHLYY